MKINDGVVAVVGAGSTGASVAYHLAKSGRKVLLIDKGQVASGMTSKSSAIVRTHYSNEIVARMALSSAQIFQNFESLGNSGFVKSGLVILVPSGLKRGTMENVAMLNKIGARNLVMEVSEARTQFPELDYSETDIIDYEPDSGYADSAGVANSYSRSAGELGAEINLGVSVRKLEVANGRIKSLILDNGTHVNCSEIVLCTNIWTRKLLEASVANDSAESFPLWAAAHPVVVFKRPKEYEGVKPIVWDYPLKTYYKPEGQSFFFVGSLDATLDSAKVDPDSFSSEVAFEYVDKFSEAVTRRIPAMSKGSFHSSYVGVYDMTPDSHPIIDELVDLGLEGVYCCVGLSGHGFKLAPALGLMVSEMLQNKSENTFDRSPFSLSRFKTGRVFRSKYEDLATVA